MPIHSINPATDKKASLDNRGGENGSKLYYDISSNIYDNDVSDSVEKNTETLLMPAGSSIYK